MVLLVLALIWGALLVSWLRSRSAGGLGDSVGTFRRHLTVLERATPGTVRPANRLYDEKGRLQGVGRRPLAAPAVATRRPSPARVTGRPVDARTSALRRRQAQKRRRDVFFALVAGATGSLALALVPGMSIMWSVQLLFDVLLAGYVALLVRLRNLAAERELKLRFIPNQQRVARRAYEFGGAGYGELELRRAAN